MARLGRETMRPSQLNCMSSPFTKTRRRSCAEEGRRTTGFYSENLYNESGGGLQPACLLLVWDRTHKTLNMCNHYTHLRLMAVSILQVWCLRRFSLVSNPYTVLSWNPSKTSVFRTTCGWMEQLGIWLSKQCSCAKQWKQYGQTCALLQCLVLPRTSRDRFLIRV